MMRVVAAALLFGRAPASEPPPSFVLDLSKLPEERWNGALATVLERHPWEYSFEPVFKAHNASLFDAIQPEKWTAIGNAVLEHWPETAAELKGISKQFADAGHEVSFDYLAGWLYFHELAHTDAASLSVDTRECTGILAQSADGPVLHGANMDQSPPAARNLTLRVRFVDGAGATVFQGVDWYALLSTGVSRAVRKGLASVQENWRTTRTRPLADVLGDIEGGVVSQMLVFRQLFTEAHKAKNPVAFEGFVESLATVRLAAPFYVVAAGPASGQGVVMARGLDVADGVAHIGEGKELDDPNDFFLAQSNYDWWLPDPEADPRRTAAALAMRRLGQDEAASLLGLFAVASTFPVHNPHTAYTALMSAATGELHAYVREASCPEDRTATIVAQTRYCPAPGGRHV